jgi:hypothetical protein
VKVSTARGAASIHRLPKLLKKELSPKLDANDMRQSHDLNGRRIPAMLKQSMAPDSNWIFAVTNDKELQRKVWGTKAY